MNKFKVGDKVKIIARCTECQYGEGCDMFHKIGKIVEFYDEEILPGEVQVAVMGEYGDRETCYFKIEYLELVEAKKVRQYGVVAFLKSIEKG